MRVFPDKTRICISGLGRLDGPPRGRWPPSHLLRAEWSKSHRKEELALFFCLTVEMGRLISSFPALRLGLTPSAPLVLRHLDSDWITPPAVMRPPVCRQEIVVIHQSSQDSPFSSLLCKANHTRASTELKPRQNTPVTLPHTLSTKPCFPPPSLMLQSPPVPGMSPQVVQTCLPLVSLRFWFTMRFPYLYSLHLNLSHITWIPGSWGQEIRDSMYLFPNNSHNAMFS